MPHALGLAWNAYAVATRIGWWTRCWQLLAAAGLAEQAGLGQRWLKSLWQHAAFLEQNLEWDLRANHLLRDAVGLAWAGRLFQGPEPGRWLDTASRLAVEQAAEQVLPDGGHFERSPMYHLHVMEDFATLSQLVEDPEARDQLRHAWRAMAEFSVWARHPDGQIPLLNDSALNGASTPDGVLRQGANLFGIPIDLSPRTGPRHFPEFGLVVWHGDPWSVFFDVGPIGPDYQPGHGHADSLTFEASYRGRRLFVDPGTCTYDRDARRDYDRSTAAHNTVCVDGEVSSEVWHIFRVGRRAYPQDVEIHITPDGLDAGAAHNGYRFLPGQPVHRRHLHVDNEGVLRLTDRVYGRGSHQVEGSLLLHPDCKASAMADGWLITAGTAQVRVRVGGPERLKLSVEDAVYHPRFGCEQAAQRLRWQVHDVLPLEVVVEICGERRT